MTGGRRRRKFFYFTIPFRAAGRQPPFCIGSGNHRSYQYNISLQSRPSANIPLLLPHYSNTYAIHTSTSHNKQCVRNWKWQMTQKVWMILSIPHIFDPNSNQFQVSTYPKYRSILEISYRYWSWRLISTNANEDIVLLCCGRDGSCLLTVETILSNLWLVLLKAFQGSETDLVFRPFTL
jgi:hypothetical protein